MIGGDVMILKFFDVDRFVLREALEREFKEIDREIDSTRTGRSGWFWRSARRFLKTMLAQIPDVTTIAA